MFRRILAITACAVGLWLATSTPAQDKANPKNWTSTTVKKWVKGRGWAVFHHRDVMRRGHAQTSLRLPKVPTVTLPCDWTNNGALTFDMDGNDQYGDCMYAMAEHVDNVWTYGMGKAGWTTSTFPLATTISCYEQLSGGDNGLGEGDLTGTSPGSWTSGLCNNPKASILAWADVDPANTALLQFCIDRGFHCNLMWSVPDSFINNFTPGQLYDSPVTPDPANGHGTPLVGLDAKGNYNLITWGAQVWITQGFLNQVQPSIFVCFSARQFDSNGYDAKGRFVQSIFADWQAAGGPVTPALTAFVSGFGPAPPPGPGPGPTPIPGNATITGALVSLSDGSTVKLITGGTAFTGTYNGDGSITLTPVGARPAAKMQATVPLPSPLSPNGGGVSRAEFDAMRQDIRILAGAVKGLQDALIGSPKK